MTPPAASRLYVVRAGALTTVQDAGRPGWAHL
ncbi:allophanate hydrolase subunit 2 family protein, partial [Streptomyces anulatus]|nr:allophanate hydrolase subunit 2 family protein [Streptomyces anulatus]